jgi:hypothetical protein
MIIAEILLKVALNTKNQIKSFLLQYFDKHKIFLLLFNKQLVKPVSYPIVYLRNKSWKPECVLTWIGEY